MWVVFGKLTPISLPVFECAGVTGYQNVSPDQLETDRQQCSCDIVCEWHALTVYNLGRRNPSLSRRTASGSPVRRRLSGVSTRADRTLAQMDRPLRIP